jgi:hypothetical protein
LVGDLLHASWKCRSSFGRFIENGNRDLLDCGKLEMEEFLKNSTFSAFDLSNMYYSKRPAQQKTWNHLLRQVIQLYREKKITAFDPVRVFSATEIPQAYGYFASRNRARRHHPSKASEVQEHVLFGEYVCHDRLFGRPR